MTLFQAKAPQSSVAPVCAKIPFSLAGRLRIALALALAMFYFAAGRLVWAQSAKPSEYEVKAVYLLNFGKFTEWPASAKLGPDEKFNVCVLGQDTFGAALDAAIANETIGHVPVAARRITRVQDAGNCRILFISASEDRQLKNIFAVLDKSTALTVGESPDFLKRGGMIHFVLEGARVRFEVNLPAAKQAGLTLSSELLKIAVSTGRVP